MLMKLTRRSRADSMPGCCTRAAYHSLKPTKLNTLRPGAVRRERTSLGNCPDSAKPILTTLGDWPLGLLAKLSLLTEGGGSRMTANDGDQLQHTNCSGRQPGRRDASRTRSITYWMKP